MTVMAAPFPTAGLFMKHEGSTVNGAVGPLYFEGASGETAAYAKDERGNTKWFNQREATEIARKLKLHLEVE